MPSKSTDTTRLLRIAALSSAVLGILALGYTLTRSRKSPTKRKKHNTTLKPKGKKIKYRYEKRPLIIHFVMGNEDGFGAYVGADKDKKNNKIKNNKNNSNLPPIGSQLIKIGNKKCENWTYQQIKLELNQLTKSTQLEFRTNDELNVLWSEAQTIKADANKDFNKKDYTSAIEKVSQAISKHPTNIILYSNRVLMLYQNAQYEKALEDCQKIRELDPLESYSKGHHLRGMVLMKLKKYKDAATAFQKVLRLKPNAEKTQNMLEKCLKNITKQRKEELDKIEKEREELKSKYPVKDQDANEPSSVLGGKSDNILSNLRARNDIDNEKDEEKDFNDMLNKNLANLDNQQEGEEEEEDEQVPDLV